MAHEDDDLRAMFADADAILTGNDHLESVVADLLCSPYDEGTQQRLVETLNGPTMQAANAAMARLTASLNEEVEAG